MADRNEANLGAGDLSGWREQIDTIDDKLLELLNERMAIAIAIAGVKRERGLPVGDVRRELAIVDRLSANSHGPLDMGKILPIFTSIFEASKDLQTEQLTRE